MTRSWNELLPIPPSGLQHDSKIENLLYEAWERRAVLARQRLVERCAEWLGADPLRPTAFLEELHAEGVVPVFEIVGWGRSFRLKVDDGHIALHWTYSPDHAISAVAIAVDGVAHPTPHSSGAVAAAWILPSVSDA